MVVSYDPHYLTVEAQLYSNSPTFFQHTHAAFHPPFICPI